MKGVIYIIVTNIVVDHEGREVVFNNVVATAWSAEDAKAKASDAVRHWNEVHVYRWSIPNQTWDKHWAFTWYDAAHVLEEIE